MDKTRIIIMGAAGRDFHNFNVVFRDNPAYDVVAFTATQIPGIADKVYPAALAGAEYPRGIPIRPESELDALIREHRVQRVVFAYSDVPHEYVMHKASAVLAAGADFWLLGPDSTQLRARVPVVAVTATRTGAGKSQTTRKVVRLLRASGKRVVAIRHPMPYGDLAAQAVQRYASYEDLDRYDCTIEEREEYEPHIDMGAIIYAGVDYERILRAAEQEADVIVWDGGNNDFPFYAADLQIVVADPLRPGHEVAYHPGETNLRRADVVVINKEDTAGFDAIEQVRANVRRVNPGAILIDAASAIFADGAEAIRGKRVLVIEDGPTLTHGEMSVGAGYVAAHKWGAAEIVSPYPYAVGSIKATYERYQQTREVLPAMGYSPAQIQDLTETMRRTPADLAIVATPIDLARVLTLPLPAIRIRYELEEIGQPTLEAVLAERFGGD